MNTNIFKTTIAALALLVAFNSCKEKDDFDYTFENCVESVGSMSEIINDGDIIQKEWIDLLDFEPTIKIKNDISDIKDNYLLYIGTSEDNLEKITIIRAADRDYALQPFAVYYVESIPYIIHSGDTSFGERQTMKFYSIPKVDLALTADYGDGEIAANIHWKLQYYYESEDTKVYGKTSDNPLSPDFYYEKKIIKHKYYDYEGVPSAVNVNLITNYDTTYNKGVLDFPAEVDSCYITQGGTREKPDYPAYIYRYWKDGKTIMYYDPVIYDFCFNVEIPVGDKECSVSDTIRGIFMDKSNCACDYEFNIYRTAKIGNKIWTIDDYRGSTFLSVAHPYHILRGDSIDFYGYKEYLYNPYLAGYGKGKYIKGYHEANEEDWNDLMSYFGINAKTDTLRLNKNICQKLEKADTTLSNYFNKDGAVQELFSSYGWTDSNGNLTETYQGVFNAVPKGNKDLTCYGQGKYASFNLRRSSRYISYIISKDYGGIALGSSGDIYGSIRYVKDE